ncbi:MAG: hypothetical protein JNL79_33860 [Myxococcales bacterium]|nr:hypothetical protein [Myxococcales bacterium]
MRGPRVRLISLVCVALGGLALLGGCAIGGAEDGVDYPDGKPTPEAGDDDAGETGDDAAPLEETGGGDATTDTGTVPPDVAPDTIFPKDDTGCTPSCTGACGAPDGCGGTCKTGTCGAGETCAAGACVAPTRSFLSPLPYAGGEGFARSITFTVDSEATAKIFFTTDGSAPSGTSSSKSNPADIFLPGTGSLRWFADTGAKEATHTQGVTVDAGEQSRYAFIVEKVSLNSAGPVVVVSPGATVSGTANVQAWNNPGCPSCRMQVLVGVGSPTACAYDWSPGAWPGATTTGATFSVKAPSSAGVHRITASFQLETGCANGIAKGFRAYKADVGVIVVK